MNEQDLDLILALASGGLSGQDAVAAEARVLADPELAQELASQRAAIDAVSSVESAAMTAEERTAMRSELMTELHLEASPTPVVAPAKRATPWWQPVFGLGAAAVFVLAILVVPGMVGGSDDSAEEAALTQQTTVASADAADSGGESSGESGSVEESAAAPKDGSDLFNLVSGEVREDEISTRLSAAGYTSLSDEKIDATDSCLDELASELDAERFIPLGVSDADADLVFLAADSGEGVEAVVTLDLSDCKIVEIDK